MIKHLHKIPDRVFFYSVILIIILWNLKYIDMPIRGLYTVLTQNCYANSLYYNPVKNLREEIKKLPDFYDSGKVGFVSDVKGNNIYLMPETVQSFYTAQYAVVPSVMKNGEETNYVIGSYVNTKYIPQGYAVVKQFSSGLYLLKKGDNRD